MSENENLQALAAQIKACDTTQPYIYVSYSTRDGAAVYEDVIALQEAGKNLWIDVQANMTGDGYNSTIFNAIADHNCKGMFFYLSEHSMTSAQSAKEVAYTKSHAITDERAALPVVVVDLDEVTDLDIDKYVNGKLYAAFKDEGLSDDEEARMKKYREKYNNRVDHVTTKYNLCEIILDVLKNQEAGQVPFTKESAERVAYLSKML
ncbi:MAG: toll/interleukin-1 receptor domain-containing protein [Peptococcaceae bacterium]|nr:toll/interleukin-1 receptor domain-containing protein [Peptococcaceae bacterium]